MTTNHILQLPGVEEGATVKARPDTVRQLKVRIAALEAENARLLDRLNDGQWMLRRGLAVIYRTRDVPPP